MDNGRWVVGGGRWAVCGRNERHVHSAGSGTSGTPLEQRTCTRTRTIIIYVHVPGLHLGEGSRHDATRHCEAHTEEAFLTHEGVA